MAELCSKSMWSRQKESFHNNKQSVNEMKQRDITPYNILKKIVPARKMVGKIARVKINYWITMD
jgi:hypothetical protein